MLFKQLYPEDGPELFLHDVTSSYLEAHQNGLAAWGYNRDGKSGKEQTVIGMLCDGDVRALSIEVFAGNTQDPHTLVAQIQKAAERFGAKAVTFVGDGGMIKGPQLAKLEQKNFHYITAITKPQIESLLKQGVLQLEVRPVYVRLEESTCRHAFVVMLAYRLVHELQRLWAS